MSEEKNWSLWNARQQSSHHAFVPFCLRFSPANMHTQPVFTPVSALTRGNKHNIKVCSCSTEVWTDRICHLHGEACMSTPCPYRRTSSFSAFVMERHGSDLTYRRAWFEARNVERNKWQNQAGSLCNKRRFWSCRKTAPPRGHGYYNFSDKGKHENHLRTSSLMHKLEVNTTQDRKIELKKKPII